MNNDRMLATAHYGSTVVNELHATNSKIISLTKTIPRLQLTTVSNVVNVAGLNQFIQKKISQ
jgi:hypothetical protein